ncbi:hypothetical protein [Streptomyces sp. GMR22]|uniref:hypothetical protein n=1 Tax=Streptomyces sp. GMR22 TaxID=2759524 RepID=UPI0018EF7A07|nr:hypothetical protein [Streptomyces sp. GMR22]
MLDSIEIQWLAAKQLRLKPTTWVRYRDYVHHDLIPALRPIRLDEPAYEHIHHFLQAQLTAGRGRPTVWHILATLSSAIGDAVRQPRLPVNVARPTVIPRPASVERTSGPQPRPSASCATATPMIRTSPT